VLSKENGGALQELLGLPAQVIPLALVPSVSAEHLPPANRFNASRVHRDAGDPRTGAGSLRIPALLRLVAPR